MTYYRCGLTGGSPSPSVPDWSEIGYSSCPQSTIDGFNYAKQIKANWTNVSSKSQAFLNDAHLMYFPKDVNTSNLTNCYEMFRGTALEDLEMSVPAVTTMERMCFVSDGGGNNLRSVHFKDVGNTITTMAQAFEFCHALTSFQMTDGNGDEVELGDITSLTNIHHMFCGCHILKGISIVSPLATASITDANNVVRDCFGMETFEFDQPKCREVQGYQLGKDTANGCLCTVSMGSASSVTNAIFEFRTSKIAAGSTFIISNLQADSTPAPFKDGATIYENSDSNIVVTVYNNQRFFASSFFQGATFPNGCNHFAISGIRACENMFNGTKFPGANKTIDLSDSTWVNCSNFTGMFGGSEVDTIIGLEDIDLSSTTSLEYLFDRCNSLTTVDIGSTSTITNFHAMFGNCWAITTIPTLDTSAGTNLEAMFTDCRALTTAPTLTISNATNLKEMFCRCYALTTVPVYDISKATNIGAMFYDCRALSTQSMDNILQMCISATSYTGTKTLYQLGFRQDREPVATVEALTHYPDFVAAGWSIGYTA